ncbi:MAG: spore coat associated protein CotJA [Erysipelotrichaceae bacterium]|nr:spore coat associated protein CotJA [Erysipelotrichaceae bacterium]
MLHKNKCCCDDDSCFERSERLFQDKMNNWNCGCKSADCSCNDHSRCDDADKMPHRHDCDPTDDMALAMAYVKRQKLNLRTLKDCDDALKSGTLFDELDLPFTRGDCDD